MTLAEQITKLAARPIGMRADEIEDFNRSRVENQMARFARKGLLHRAKITHRNTRFFTSVKTRDAFVVSIEAQRKEVERKYTGERVSLAKVKEPQASAPWAADAPVIVPAGLRIQYGPSHPPRYAEHVMSFVHGGLRCG